MNEERIFNISNLSFSNLSELSEKESNNFEMRICELAYIASEIAESAKKLIVDGININEVFTLLSEEITNFFEGKYDSSRERDEEFKERVCGFVSKLSELDKANLASLILERMNEAGISVGECDFLPSLESEEIFTYVKNSLADEAFDVLSENFSDPRVAYSDSFKEACFAVADGKAGYCILPFEEKGGIPIPTIQFLISALDLKISALTPVFGYDGTADMKYALVGRGFSIPEIGEDIDRYLEIKISDDDSMSIASILSVAEYFGITVYRITTMADNSSVYYSLVLRDSGKSFTEFLIFLNIFVPAYIPVGIYKNLE